MYCLDTNIVIYYQNNNKKVVNKLLSVNEDDLCITHITRMELFYGAFKSQRIQENLILQSTFCDEIEVVNSSKESDEIFGKIKSNLKKSGLITDDLDLIIASICLANDLTLVTKNTKHFENIQGLKLEDWS
jgi:tRNA(fMet)-specific endonuclease VapC